MRDAHADRNSSRNCRQKNRGRDARNGKKLISAGRTVVIERRAGVKAVYIDSAYEQVGATLTDDAYQGSQMILKVRAPRCFEIQIRRQIHRLLPCFDPYRNTELDQFASQQSVLRLLWSYCHGLIRAQNMDALSSQTNFVRLQVCIVLLRQSTSACSQC